MYLLADTVLCLDDIRPRDRGKKKWNERVDQKFWLEWQGCTGQSRMEELHIWEASERDRMEQRHLTGRRH